MIANHKGEVPVIVLILPFLAGIAGGINYLSANAGWITALLIILSIAFIVLNLTYTQFGIYKVRWLGGSLIYLILFLLGWMVTTHHSELNSDKHFSKKSAQYLAVVINSEPKLKGDVVRFTANVKQTIGNGKTEEVSGSVLITIKDNLAKKLFYGEELLIPAKYSPIEPPFNPGEFNYKNYLANHNIHYQAFLFPKQYVIVKAGEGNPVIAYALQLRQNLVAKLKANMKDTTAIAVASTLILGYKADLGNDILQAYSKTGTIHILSVSGGHVAIIYLLLSWALGFLNGYKHGRVFKAILIIALIWAYSLLTGFSPAVCRAAVMLSLIITGKTYSRYINTLNILAVSAFAMLLYNPFLITDVGFQLSYLAVAGLIIFQPVVYQWLTLKNKVADKIWLACSVSIAAQVITFPLSAYYFHQFPVYFLVSNLLIVIPVSIILYSGILLLLLPQMAGVSQALGYILEKCILLMNKVLAYIEHAPYASIGKIWLSTFEYLLLYAITLLVFYFIYNKKAWFIKAALVCTLFFSISIGVKHFRVDNNRSVTFLNLRKHSGIVFKNGNKGIVLTDLRDTDKNFQYAVQPGLDSTRLTDYKVYSLNSNVQSAYLIKQGGLVQFLNKRLAMLNHSTSIRPIPPLFKTDYLYVTNNTYVDSAVIANSNMLIIDGSNTDKRLNQLIEQSKKLNVNYKILKRNKSFVAISN
ncbi:ComEC/Rec2 family competence protein [Mucilaginibacter sp.]|jgi:competence protein ComEC|uniref:ComEC/Rec2 family competence protein n=1 Tax=Mucilaginibacter sp. TaxID=1882438 RepID=UPI00356A7424